MTIVSAVKKPEVLDSLFTCSQEIPKENMRWNTTQSTEEAQIGNWRSIAKRRKETWKGVIEKKK
jgi:hypothetical protein